MYIPNDAGIIKESTYGYHLIPIQDEMLSHREVELVGEVTPETVNALVRQLRYHQRQDPEGPITLYINSPGGSVDSGMALYDVMQAVSCPIRTICVGLAASMAALLFISGGQRDMLPHSRLMIHDPLILQTGGSALKLKALSDDLMETRQIIAKVIPNLLHTGESLIVADTKGNLHRLYGKYLEERGYTVMHLDFTDVANTPWGYNPLSYIRPCEDAGANRDGDWYSEQDVKKVAQAVCPCQSLKDPFWDLAAQMYLEAILLFILNQLPQERHSLYEAYTFLSRMEALDDIITEEVINHPNSAFVRKIWMIQQNKAAEKMDASIKGILARHLDVLANSATRRMFQMERPQKEAEANLEEERAI